MPSLLVSGLHEMETNGLISADEHGSALRAENSGDSSQTLGLEIEILRVMASGMSTVIEKEAGLNRYVGSLWKQCDEELGLYGYRAVKDGLYEVNSPAAYHPDALTIATRGIIRTGWLPEKANSIVPLHISVGTSKPIHSHSPLHYRAIQMERAIDLTGGSSPQRLKTTDHAYMWNGAGFLGVTASTGIASRALNDDLAWEGDNKRLEFRSFLFDNPVQLERTLQRVHFLCKGLFAPAETPQAEVYKDFEASFADYCAANKLLNTTTADPAQIAEIKDESFMEYTQSYANHLAKIKQKGDSELDELVGITVQTLARLEEQTMQITIDEKLAVANS